MYHYTPAASTPPSSATTLAATTTEGGAVGTTAVTINPYAAYSAQYAQYTAAATATGTSMSTSIPYFSAYPHSVGVNIGMSSTVPSQSTKTKIPQTPPVDRPPSPPDLVSSITPNIASKAMRRIICQELREAGFNSAQASVVQKLEFEVVALVEELFSKAHEYANLANRAGPIASDLVLACDDYNLPPAELYSVQRKALGRKKSSTSLSPTKTEGAVPLPSLVPPPSRSPSPELLPSDDESGAPTRPTTLRGIGSYFPTLPPKHTYLRTPASPPKKAALPSLEKKLKTAALVQKSLGNLLSNTEDNTKEDDKLFGHIVNWEMGVYPRKRWKYGS